MQPSHLLQGSLACCAVAMTSYDQPWPGVEYISDSPDLSDKEYFSEELFSPDEETTPSRSKGLDNSAVGRVLFSGKGARYADKDEEMQSKILEELKKSNSRFDSLADRFDTLSDRLVSVESRLCSIEKNQSEILSTPSSSTERRKKKLSPKVRVS